MRTLGVSDNAVTRKSLSGFVRRQSSTIQRLKLPEHGITVMFELATRPDGRAPYKAVMDDLGFTANQMSRVVRGLVKRRVIVRVHDAADHRKLDLQLTKKGQNAYEDICNFLPPNAKDK
jgi:DNA-binding MarR family transcriptional regulator